MRKDAGFDVTDKILVKFDGNEKLVSAIENFSGYIANETLADKVEKNSVFNGGIKQNWTIGELNCTIQIEKLNL